MQIAKIAGIPIRVNFSWPLFFVPLSCTPLVDAGLGKMTLFEGVITSLLVFLLLCFLFACITAHEYGHALTARYFGYKAHYITWFPFGAVATLEGEIYRTPLHEFLVSIAGPLTSAVLGGIFGLLSFIFESDLLYLVSHCNLIWTGFNLLPVYPMDGGRILRSLIGRVVGPLKATKVVYVLACVLSVVMSAILFWRGYYVISVALPIFAIFIGGVELKEIIRKEVIEKWEENARAAKEAIIREEAEKFPEPVRQAYIEVEMLVFDLSLSAMGLIMQSHFRQPNHIIAMLVEDLVREAEAFLKAHPPVFQRLLAANLDERRLFMKVVAAGLADGYADTSLPKPAA